MLLKGHERRRKTNGLVILSLQTAALVVLLMTGYCTNAFAASPETPEAAPGFSYDLYCDAKGHFVYDGAALKLVKQPSHLARVYADAKRGEERANELVRELEQSFYQVGIVVAHRTTRPACLPLPELTPECQPNWHFLSEFLGETPEAERLREVVARGYEVRAKERGQKNQVIVAAVNLLVAGGLAKSVMAQNVVARGAAAEVRAAARETLAPETGTAQAEVQATSRIGLAAKRGTTTAGDLTAAAARARAAVGPGQGPVYGTQTHAAFKAEVEALGRGNLYTEVSYLRGKVVPYGTKGSVRLDVVEGPLDAPTAVFDLKIGSATLTPARIDQLRSHLPGGGNIPISEIR